MMYPRYLALLSQALGGAGRTRAGLRTLAVAKAQAKTSGERLYLAEILRQEAELILAQGAATEAEYCLLQAIGTAREQGARALQLRAATSLARLWWRQGKAAQGLGVLQESYRSVTEGFAAADLREAKALLEQLAQA